jgi:hypothetical protein
MARRKQAERAAAEAMKARRAYYQHIRTNRQRRQMLYAFGPILAVIIGLVGYAYYTFEYARPRQPVARVSGQAITASVFSQRLQYSRRQVLNNVRQLVGMIQTDDKSFITQYANGQRSGVVQSTLDALIDEVLIQKEAEARGVTVADQEVHDEICRQLQTATKITSPSDATATAAAAESEGVTATDAVTTTDAITTTDPVSETVAGAPATPTDTAKPACELSEVEFNRAFDELYKPVLTEAGMTRATYDNLVRMNLYREALNKAIGAEIPTISEQVEVEYLVFNDSGAAAGAAALAAAKSGTSFNALLTQYGPRAVDDETAGSPTSALTETVSADGATATFQTDPASAGATEATTATGATTSTGATGALSDTAAAAPPTPAPLPTTAPDPYAVVKSDGKTWYTKESMKTELGFIDADVDKIFALAAGKAADALIKGSQGNYLVVVHQKDAERELPETELQTKRDGALEEWLKKTRTEKSAEISKFPLDVHTPPEPQWYIDGFTEIMGTADTQPPLDVASMLTQQPASTPAP